MGQGGGPLGCRSHSPNGYIVACSLINIRSSSTHEAPSQLVISCHFLHIIISLINDFCPSRLMRLYKGVLLYTYRLSTREYFHCPMPSVRKLKQVNV